MKKVFISAIFLVVLGVVLIGCQGKDDTANTKPMNFIINSPEQLAAPQAGDSVAIIETDFGTVKFKLFRELAPETAKNFIELTKTNFYDKLTFHRIINNFMIQGGDPNGNGSGGYSYKGPGTLLRDEINEKLTHIRGAVSMANAGKNTSGSQFFIVQRAEGVEELNGGYSVFGQVYEGMDVVDAIAKVQTGAKDRPMSPVVMKKVTIEVVK